MHPPQPDLHTPSWFNTWMRLLYGDRLEHIMERSVELGLRMGTEILDAEGEREILRVTLDMHEDLAAMLRGAGLSPLRRLLLEAYILPYAPIFAVLRRVARLGGERAQHTLEILRYADGSWGWSITGRNGVKSHGGAPDIETAFERARQSLDFLLAPADEPLFHSEPDPWAIALAFWDPDEDVVTAEDALAFLGVPDTERTHVCRMRIATILKHAGWTRSRRPYTNTRGWTRP